MKREQEQTRLSTADFAAVAEGVKEKQKPDAEAGERQPERTESRDEQLAPLFSDQDARELRSRWGSIQTGFVDEPRHAVAQADELVAEVMRRLAESFSKEKAQLESQWDQGDKVSTEELRLTLRRYRSFFERFLSL